MYVFCDKFSYLLTYSLIPWCRIFFENIHGHKSQIPDAILSQPNPLHPIDPNELKVFDSCYMTKCSSQSYQSLQTEWLVPNLQALQLRSLNILHRNVIQSE